MNIIKIPSSNIYDIEDNTSLIKSNKIDTAEQSYNDFKKKNGNVLSKEYVITYWQEVNTDGKISLTYVGNNDNVNEFVFVLKSYVEDNTLFSLAAWAENIILPSNKILSVRTGDKGQALDYRLVRKQRYLILDSTRENPSYEEKIITSKNIFYNIVRNSFTADIFVDTHENYSGTIVAIVPSAVGANYTYLIQETITIEGIYYESELITRYIGYGYNNIVDCKLPTSELVQASNLIYVSGEEPRAAIDSVADNVSRKYQNGKEVYKLKCSIAKYYSTAGDLLIFPEDDAYANKLPATFKKYDIVEPWIYTSKGEVPLSEKSDGTPKQFEVIGIDYSYAGVVWQKLTLQEYIE